MVYLYEGVSCRDWCSSEQDEHCMVLATHQQSVVHSLHFAWALLDLEYQKDCISEVILCVKWDLETFLTYSLKRLTL